MNSTEEYTYHFTRHQLNNLLSDAIAMYNECLESYTDNTDMAIAMAITETMQGLDADLEIKDDDEWKLRYRAWLISLRAFD